MYRYPCGREKCARCQLELYEKRKKDINTPFVNDNLKNEQLFSSIDQDPSNIISRIYKAYNNGYNSIGTFTAHGRGLNFVKQEMQRIIKELEEKGY